MYGVEDWIYQSVAEGYATEANPGHRREKQLIAFARPRTVFIHPGR